jgi:hypothetical protein
MREPVTIAAALLPVLAACGPRTVGQPSIAGTLTLGRAGLDGSDGRAGRRDMDGSPGRAGRPGEVRALAADAAVLFGDELARGAPIIPVDAGAPPAANQP